MLSVLSSLQSPRRTIQALTGLIATPSELVLPAPVSVADSGVYTSLAYTYLISLGKLPSLSVFSRQDESHSPVTVQMVLSSVYLLKFISLQNGCADGLLNCNTIRSMTDY